MQRVLVLVLLSLATACAPNPEVAAIAECEAQPAACGAAARTLCEQGAARTSALLAAAPNPKTASAALRALVFEHALCSTGAEAPPEVVSRVVASLDADRLTRLAGFEPPLRYRVFGAAIDAGLEPPLPFEPRDAAWNTDWCRDVYSVAAKRAQTSLSAMSRALSVDCGSATDTGITAVARAVEAPALREWAALASTHGADQTKIDAGRAAFRAKQRQGRPMTDRTSFGLLWVSLVDRIGETERPWRWLKPVFDTTLACGSLNSSMVEFAQRRPGWTALGRTGFARGLAAYYARCPDSSALWSLVAERLGAEGQPLTDQLFAVGGPCGSLAMRAGALRKIAQMPDLKKRAAGLPSAAKQDWLVNEAIPAYTAAFKLFEADARRRCPGTLQ